MSTTTSLGTAPGSVSDAAGSPSCVASSSSSSSSEAVSTSTVTSTSIGATPSQQLHQRLQQTNSRIIHLLEQMSWQENHRRNPASTTASTALSSSSSSSTSRTTSTASQALSTSSPHSSSSVFSQCRPFDRAYFLRYVSTYTPLVWSAKDSPLLSPLVCARYGWIAASSPLQRDHIHCTLCRAQIHILFSSALQFTPESYSSLAQKYHTLLMKGHQVDCPWSDNPYDENFALLYPTGPANTHTPHATRVWIALNQVKSRAQSFDGPSRSLLDRLKFSSYLQEQLKAVVQRQPKAVAAAIPSLEQIPAATLLSICGWEKRSRFGLGEEVQNSDSSSATTESSSLVFQCGFGCREVHQVSEFLRPTEAGTTDGSHNEEQSATQSKESEAAAGEADDEERSDFQSPLKKRKLPDDASAATLDSASFPSSSPPMTSPTQLQFVSEGGFDPLRAHRMFCPFIREFTVPADEAETPNAAANTTSTSTSDLKPASATDGMDGQPGWTHLFTWWLQRQQQKRQRVNDNSAAASSSTAAAGTASSSDGSETNASPPPPAGLSAMHSVLHPAVDASSLMLNEKERTYQGIVDTVRKLLQPPTNNKAALTRALALLDTNARANQASIKLSAPSGSSPTKKRPASEL